MCLGEGCPFFDSLDNPGVSPGKYIEVDTSKLETLTVIPDNDPPGHVTVRPNSDQELLEWAATRGTGRLHAYTLEILAAVSRIGKK